jgi:hypothetical protein
VTAADPTVRARRSGFISLTPDQVTQLKSQVDANGTVSADALIAAGAGSAKPVTFLQRTDLNPLCRPLPSSTEDCMARLSDAASPTAAPTPTPTPASPPAPVSPQDLPAFVGRLIDPMSAPEQGMLGGLTPQATLASVKNSIAALSFEPSPADGPAYYNFTQLQIAFQDVWQELIDKGVLDLAQDAYETIVELGGDPTRPEYKGQHPVRALKAEANLALRAVRAASAPVVRDHRNGAPQGGVTVTVTAGGTVRDHRGDLQADDPAVRLPALLTELEGKLREKYAFTIFATNGQERAVNFGILLEFQQRWQPEAYQPGKLVKSIPLAPNQTQRVVVTRKTSKKRTRKELENNLRVERDEVSETSRSEQEIASRAQAKTSFSLENKAEGGVEGVGTDTTTTGFKQEADKSSDDVKKAFRESVFKSAQEVKTERTTEISTDATEDRETTETTEISNQNKEIAVTYLFYELQRRYRLHERLYRVTPVVLVAQEVPAPEEIDQAWLIANDWILKRAILDDSFLPTLERLTQTAGAETALAELAANVSQQRQIVAELRNELAIAQRAAAVTGSLIGGAVGQQTGGGGLLDSVISGVEDAVFGGMAVKAAEMVFGGDAGQNQSNQNALQTAADQAADRVRDLNFRLEREVTALNAITETYAKALEAHHTLLTDIARLRVHAKSNIFYYMRKIWEAEPPDQRYFRLHNTPIPTLKPQSHRITIAFDKALTATAQPAHRALARFGGLEVSTFPAETVMTFPAPLEFKPLAEVADLTNWLGCKGNMFIFPLVESNPLTDYMMAPYIDRATGELVDPSDPLGWSLDEFSQYVCCLEHELSEQDFEALLPTLKAQYQALLTARLRQDDLLVVPTNSLFIECLPAGHSQIEEFQREHRMIDVLKAKTEAREGELENLRLASRLLAGRLSDPKVDKRVKIETAAPSSSIVVPTD